MYLQGIDKLGEEAKKRHRGFTEANEKFRLLLRFFDREYALASEKGSPSVLDGPVDPTAWKLVIAKLGVVGVPYGQEPIQTNGYDCGILAIRWLEHRMRGAIVDFTCADMRYHRQLLQLELLNGRPMRVRTPAAAFTSPSGEQLEWSSQMGMNFGRFNMRLQGLRVVFENDMKLSTEPMDLPVVVKEEPGSHKNG